MDGGMTDEGAPPPAAILAQIRKKSALIAHLRQRRDEGKFRNVADAVALQKAVREREQLRAQLPPLSLV